MVGAAASAERSPLAAGSRCAAERRRGATWQTTSTATAATASRTAPTSCAMPDGQVRVRRRVQPGASARAASCSGRATARGSRSSRTTTMPMSGTRRPVVCAATRTGEPQPQARGGLRARACCNGDQALVVCRTAGCGRSSLRTRRAGDGAGGERSRRAAGRSRSARARGARPRDRRGILRIARARSLARTCRAATDVQRRLAR